MVFFTTSLLLELGWMFLEEVGTRRKLAHRMIVLTPFSQLGKRQKIMVPAEERFGLEVQIRADFLAACGNDGMHEHGGRPQQVRGIGKHGGTYLPDFVQEKHIVIVKRGHPFKRVVRYPP